MVDKVILVELCIIAMFGSLSPRAACGNQVF